MSFKTEIDEIKKLVISIDPARYACSRNFKKGAVSKLGPYISRGTLSTKNLSSHKINRNSVVQSREVHTRTGLERLLATGMEE